MNKYLENDRGITLVELLAVIVIGSLMLILISNIHIFGHKQSNDQSENSKNLFDVSYAAKMITKEVRKAETVNAEGDILTLNRGKQNEIVFKKQSTSLVMNGSPIVKEISEFIVHPKGSTVDKKNILLLTIKGKYLEGKRSTEEITTEIFIRGENLNE
ncbi:PilW family protein [Sporosarcina sp. 6E9]|uniref:PilW family protein n=1 Tax=Sporosarcina sp. 6E9 TaxID=2819235 RepID=UPI001B3145E7|nr:prepilin-type N-terminal cleavage/methylation domain-containing protein [Sporosarcina sp. 6E9]